MSTYRIVAYRDSFGLVWSEQESGQWVAEGFAERLSFDTLHARPGLVPLEVDDQEALLAENDLLRRWLNAARFPVPLPADSLAVVSSLPPTRNLRPQPLVRRLPEPEGDTNG